MSWVMAMYVPPFCACTFWISWQSSAVRTGSRPESGSSNMTIFGWRTSARASPALAHAARELGRSLAQRGRQTDLVQPPVDNLGDLGLLLLVFWRNGNATLS
jgi:hypothetical protein